MTRDEAIKIILLRLGNRANDKVLQQAAIDEMAMIQRTILERADFKPWFLLSEMLRTVTPSDGVESRLPVPAGFLEEQEEGSLWILPAGATAYIPLDRKDPAVLEERWGDAVGQPQQYALVKNYFVLYPTPDKAYPLKVRCYLSEPLITYPYGYIGVEAITTNAWLTEVPDWIIGETGAIIAGLYVKDQATAQMFADMASKAKERLYVQHVAREEMNRERSAGDD